MNFLEAIRGAQSVTRFSFTVTTPNPHDVNKLIQGPAKEFTKEAGGEKTKVEVEGKELDKGLIEDVTMAVAADGQEAAANIRLPDGGAQKRVHLSGNPVVERVDTPMNETIFSSILDGARRAYRRVRGTAQQK